MLLNQKEPKKPSLMSESLGIQYYSKRRKFRAILPIFIGFVVLTVLLLTVANASNEDHLDCVDALNMPAMLEYIRNNNEGSYFEEKERAQKVLDQLHEKLDERLAARIKAYTIEYKRYMDESSDDYHPLKGGRLPQVIQVLRDSHENWKKHIKSEHWLVNEESLGGTGSYYWANLWEIEQLVIRLGGTIN